MTETATADTGARTAGTRSSGDEGGQGVGLRAAAHDAADQARSMAEIGKEEATKVMSEVRSQTSNLVGEAGHKVRDRAESQVGSAARLLGDMSDELDRMAGSSMSGSPLTSLARDGATAMRSVARRLEEGGLDAAMHDVRSFARRRPVVFLAGAFAIGMFAGRLVRNTDVGSVTQQVQRDDGNGRPAASGSATLDTGTTARVERGMARALDDALAAEAGMPIGSADLSSGIEGDWDAPRLQGSQPGRHGGSDE